MKVYLECLHNYAAWGIWKARTAKILQGKAVSVKEVVFLAFQQAEERFEVKAYQFISLTLLSTGTPTSVVFRSINTFSLSGSSYNMVG